MSERHAPLVLLILCASLALGCSGRRRVDLLFSTPAAESCARPAPDGGTTPQSECPLADVQFIATEVRGLDGRSAAYECQPAPPGFCTLDDLAGVQLIQRFDPIDGAEITLTGFTDPDCAGRIVLSCDSLGESVIALGAVDQVTLWCDCPTTAAGP